MTTAERKVLQKEMIDLMLKRANITKSDIYETAMKLWVRRNLDLLTPTEIQHYKSKVLL